MHPTEFFNQCHYIKTHIDNLNSIVRKSKNHQIRYKSPFINYDPK